MWCRARDLGWAWGPGRREGLGKAAERWGQHRGLWGWAPAVDQAPASPGALTPRCGARTLPVHLEQLEAVAGGEVWRSSAQKSLEELGGWADTLVGPGWRAREPCRARDPGRRAGSERPCAAGRVVCHHVGPEGAQAPGAEPHVLGCHPRARAGCPSLPGACRPSAVGGERAAAGQPWAAQAWHPAVPGGHTAPTAASPPDIHMTRIWRPAHRAPRLSL